MKTKIFLLTILVIVSTVAMFFLFIAGAHIVKWLIETNLVFIFCPVAYIAICAWDSLKEKRTTKRVQFNKSNNSKNVA